MKRFVVFLLMFFVIGASALSFHRDGGGSGTGTTTVSYGPDQEQKIDLCLPSGTGPWSVALLIHGNGWYGGDKSDMLGDCRNLANRGIVGAAVNFRMAEGWPTQINDIRAAYAWLAANRSDIDASRVCAFGVSSGGFRAAWFGLLEPEADCVATESGVFDSLDHGGGLILTEGATLESISPILQMHAGMPPTLIVHGSYDTGVPPLEAQAMRDAMLAVGADVTYLELPFGHTRKSASRTVRRQIINAIYGHIEEHLLP